MNIFLKTSRIKLKIYLMKRLITLTRRTSFSLFLSILLTGIITKTPFDPNRTYHNNGSPYIICLFPVHLKVR